MHLDETMLQSNTAINLVEYIDRLVELLGDEVTDDEELSRDYRDIKEKHAKAIKRRSIRYRPDLD